VSLECYWVPLQGAALPPVLASEHRSTQAAAQPLLLVVSAPLLLLQALPLLLQPGLRRPPPAAGAGAAAALRLLLLQKVPEAALWGPCLPLGPPQLQMCRWPPLLLLLLRVAAACEGVRRAPACHHCLTS
jgi:hypothetical protein